MSEWCLKRKPRSTISKIGNGTFKRQLAMPRERMGACAVSAYDNDTDTAQVFLYGGGSGPCLFDMGGGFFMGDLFILQLPLFRWFAYNDSKCPRC